MLEASGLLMCAWEASGETHQVSSLVARDKGKV